MSDFWVHLRGVWAPMPSELDRLIPFEERGRDDILVYHVEGRGAAVRLQVKGHNGGTPVPLCAGEAYFVECRGDLMRDGQRIRRTVRVLPRPSEKALAGHVFDLDYLSRPITALEALRAVDAFKRPGGCGLVRLYEDGSRDELAVVGQGARVRWRSGGEDGLPLRSVAGVLDEHDWKTPGIVRPDWRRP